MKLNYKLLSSHQPERVPVLILHGLFGSLDNWLTVGKALSESRDVYLVDQRNHGNSPHSDSFDYPAMAKDIYELVIDLNVSKVHLVGHSMGGKTAMFFACQYPDLLHSLTVVDISPRYYPPHHQDILKAFKVVDPSTLQSREEAQERISTVIQNKGIQLFLLKNLQREGQHSFSWKHNLNVIAEQIENVGEELPHDFTYDGSCLFIGGSNSDYITQNDNNLINHHFPEAKQVTIKDAGHWVHAEKPQELMQTLRSFYSVIDTNS